MFETTLEAQNLHTGDNRLGTLSAAALAHLGIGLAIVAVTAVLVPPVHVPDPPSTGIVIAVLEPFPKNDEGPAHQRPPRQTAKPSEPKTAVVLTPPEPTSPPVQTPDTLPDPPTEPETGDDGRGAPGVENSDGNEISGGPGEGHGEGVGEGDGDGGANAGPLALTGDMQRPVLLSKVEPAYPNAARLARLPGKVIVEAVIGLDGGVESAEVISSTSTLFDGAAVDAVRQWRYKPALMSGQPVRVYFTVVVSFVLR